MLAVIVACGALFSSCKEKYDPSGSGDIDLSDPLTIEAVEEGEVDLTLEVNLPEPVYYSVNGGEKKVVAMVDEEKGVTYTTLELKAGDKVQLFSRNTKLSDQKNNKYFNIYFESECYVYGNVMSLISPDDNWKDNKEIKAPSVFRDCSHMPASRLIPRVASGCLLQNLQKIVTRLCSRAAR